MRKKLAALLMAVIIAANLCSGCAAGFAGCTACAAVMLAYRGDGAGGEYQIGNGYAIVRFGGEGNRLVRMESETYGCILLDEEVLSFAYNESCIVLKTQRERTYPNGTGSAAEEDVVFWYICDTEKMRTLGPFVSNDEFEEKCSELGIGDLCGWIDTGPAPFGKLHG